MRLVRSSISFKFNLIVALVVLALLTPGVYFVYRQVSLTLDRDLGLMGENVAGFLVGASADSLILHDVMRLDELAEHTRSAEDVLYAYVLDKNDNLMTSVQGSFNPEEAVVSAVLEGDRTGDVAAIVERVKSRVKVTEITRPVELEGQLLGTVVVGLYSDENQATLRRTAYTMFVVTVGLVAMLVAVITVMFRLIIARPLERVTGVSSLIAEGDLTRTLNEGNGDEVGRLSRSMNAMSRGLREIINHIKDEAGNTTVASTRVKSIADQMNQGSRLQAASAESASEAVDTMSRSLRGVAESTVDLQASNEQMSSTILEMMTSLGELARQAEELSTSVDSTAAAITQMSAAIKQIAGHTQEVSGSVEKVVSTVTEMDRSIEQVDTLAKESSRLSEQVAAEVRQNGLESMRKTREGMDRIEKTVTNSSSIIDSLGARAENVGGILKVINDISDSTSLLALNASILAAQAGEHGRGFAVVASEIRELAERTSQSTKEIADMTAAFRREARSAVEAMEECNRSVAEGKQVSEEHQAGLMTILEKADQSLDMGRKIVTVTREQSQGMGHVARTVEQIHSMIGQINQATQEQKSGSALILKTSETMYDITKKVRLVTEEHARGGKDIINVVEVVKDKVGSINQALQDLQNRGHQIVESVRQIQGVLQENTAIAGSLSEIATSFQAQSESLGQEVSRFRLG